MYDRLNAFEKLFKPRYDYNPKNTLAATVHAKAPFLKQLLALTFGAKHMLIG